MTTQQMIEGFLRLYPNAGNGPAHIVLEDGNLRDSDIEFCEGLTRTTLTGNADDMSGKDWADSMDALTAMNWYKNRDRQELWATLYFLHDLSKISEDIRENDEEIDTNA